jgi:hypothetical protein
LGKLLAKSPNSSDTQVIADPFMFQDSYREQSSEQIANIFGNRFAQAMLELKPGIWQGPVESGFGWHLVLVESTTPGRIPTFEEAESLVKADWITEQRVEIKQKMYEAMASRYQVELRDILTKAAAGVGAPMAAANR